MAVIIIGGYVLFNFRFLITGPQINIVSPENGSQFEEPTITLIGKTKNISFISLNDRPIFVDEDGNFSEKLLLSPGLSIIELYGQDRFDRETRILLQYVYTGEVILASPTLQEPSEASSSEEIAE